MRLTSPSGTSNSSLSKLTRSSLLKEKSRKHIKNGMIGKDVLSQESYDELEQLIEILSAVKQGDFTVRFPCRNEGILSRAGELLNDIIGLNEHMAYELI